MFGSYVLKSVSGNGRLMGSICPSVVTRSAVTYISSLEETSDAMRDFTRHLEKCGVDEYPYHRKEFLKPKERRYMKNNAKKGKMANQKVHGLVEFINYKRANKFQ